ncbi:MAG: branched-chain amino acid ABC transporter permease [Vulcanimicrobiaceae bacterium]
MVKTVLSSLLLLVAIAIPFVAPGAEYVMDVLFLIFLYGAMSAGWNIIGGFAGQVSFGHAAFLGIGAYTTAILVQRGLPIAVAFVLSGVLAASYSLLIGLPCFRLTGPYFSIATIGIGEATRLIALNWTSLTGGASGVTLPGAPPIVPQYFAALGLLVVVTGITIWIQRSRLGYALAAVRSDPDAAQTLGVNTTIAKTQALFISAFIVGCAGSIYALHYLYISPESVFGFTTSIALVIMPIIGGIGTVTGPLIGAVIYTFIREQLEANFQNLDLLAFGLLLMAIVLFEPRGLVGAFQRLTNRKPKRAPARTAGAIDG